MSTAYQDTATLRAPRAQARPEPRARHGRDGWMYLALGLLTAVAWWINSLQLFSAGSPLGYWLGVAGGVTMLGVFAYPARKHLRFMQRWGAGKHWFVVHMAVGVVGPFTILVHSTFKIGSINAGVALLSMVVVALSGVAGRFLYVRVHRNLQGEKLSLGEMRKAVTGDASAIARLKFAPKVQAELAAYEQHMAQRHLGLPAVLLGTWALTLRRRLIERRCARLLRMSLLAAAQQQAWSRREFRAHLRSARALATGYLRSVQRIAEFSAWDRLFSLWHVLHVPFVYMMVLSAVAHVVAVHIY